VSKNEVAERHLRNAVLKAVSGMGARLFRVNTGMAWAGRPETYGTAVFIRDAYPIRMGLCEGGSDLIGWTPITITPEMVGQTVAVFTAIELKCGRTATTEAQTNFLAQVSRAGGIATVARGVGDAVALLRAWLRPERHSASRRADTVDTTSAPADQTAA
jgi:hypothetical protein